MIRVLFQIGKKFAHFHLPASNLFDIFEYAGIPVNISIGDEHIILFSPDSDDELANMLCERLLESDYISDVNDLCVKVMNSKVRSLLPRSCGFSDILKRVLSKTDIRGVNNISEETYKAYYTNNRHLGGAINEE